MKNNHLLMKALIAFVALIIYYEYKDQVVEYFTPEQNNESVTINGDGVHQQFKLVKDDGSGLDEDPDNVMDSDLNYSCDDIQADKVKMSWYFVKSKDSYRNHRTQIKLILCPYDCDGKRWLKIASIDMVNKKVVETLDLMIPDTISESKFIENCMFSYSYSMTTPTYSRDLYDENGMRRTEQIMDYKREHLLNELRTKIEIPDYE